MSTASKMSGADRRTAIIRAARDVFIEKGFYRTTTRELAKAAHVSEALLFKHFPNKDALYSAIQRSCFNEEGAKVAERLEAVEPSTAGLVFLVRDLISHVLGAEPEADAQVFFRLVLRSLMDEGAFTRLAIQGGPTHWVTKVEQCIVAARAAGDMQDATVDPAFAGWIVHQLISGFMVHSLPSKEVINYGVSRDELVEQITWFSLRGMGMKEEALQRLGAEQDRGASRPTTPRHA